MAGTYFLLWTAVWFVCVHNRSPLDGALTQGKNSAKARDTHETLQQLHSAFGHWVWLRRKQKLQYPLLRKIRNRVSISLFLDKFIPLFIRMTFSNTVLGESGLKCFDATMCSLLNNVSTSTQLPIFIIIVHYVMHPVISVISTHDKVLNKERFVWSQHFKIRYKKKIFFHLNKTH